MRTVLDALWESTPITVRGGECSESLRLKPVARLNVAQVLAEMGEEEQDADAGAEVSSEASAMKPSPSALMLAAGLASAQNTLRGRESSAGTDDLHCAPSTELQAG